MGELLTPANVSTELSSLFNAGSIDTLIDLYADSAVYVGPDVLEPLVGKQAIQKQFRSYFDAFPDMSTRHEVLAEQENRVIITGITTGTHTGPFKTPWGVIQPSMSRIEFEYVIVFTFNAAREIVEDRTYFDFARVLGQMGFLSRG